MGPGVGEDRLLALAQRYVLAGQAPHAGCLAGVVPEVGATPPACARPHGVVLANCPFHTMAQRHPALVCGRNLDLLAGLAGALDDRVTARLEPEAGLCCVRLRA